MTDDENSDKWHLRDLQPQAFMKKPGLHPSLSTCPVEFSLTNHYQAAQAPLHGFILKCRGRGGVMFRPVFSVHWCEVGIWWKIRSRSTYFLSESREIQRKHYSPLKFKLLRPSKIGKVVFQPSCFQGRAVKLQRCDDINKLEAFACTMRHHVWKNTHADASQNITHKRKMHWKSLWVSKKLAVLEPQLKPG